MLFTDRWWFDVTQGDVFLGYNFQFISCRRDSYIHYFNTFRYFKGTTQDNRGKWPLFFDMTSVAGQNVLVAVATGKYGTMVSAIFLLLKFSLLSFLCFLSQHLQWRPILLLRIGTT
jgi:hypothetical protein